MSICLGTGNIYERKTGGRGGIRTHGEFNPTLDFESSALNRTQPPFQASATMKERAGFAIRNGGTISSPND